jgi:EmrB/QacA subfamily drug resistance transporter
MTAKKKWVLTLGSLASLMAALDTLVVATALTTIRRHLHASIGELEWTVNAYNLSFAVLLMTAAALGDRFGRRRVFASGLGLFSVASAACALAPSVGFLIAARAVQGVGAALIAPLALTLVSAAFAPEERGKAMGLFQGITGLSVATGPVIGGAIAQGIAWQWIFWVNVPIGLLAIPFVRARIDESYGADVGVDGRGLALVTGAALGIVWGLVRGNSAGWGSFEVVGALGAGVLLGAAFVAWERRARVPMVPLSFFRSRPFSAGNAGIFLQFGSLFASVFFFAQFMQSGLGFSPLGAGLRLVPWTATLFFVAPLAGVLVGRVGERPLIVGGLAMQGAGMAWIALIAKPGMAYGSLVPAMVVCGCGVSLAMPALQNVVVGAVGEREIGKASGTFTTMRELGGVFGIATAVAVFAGAGGYASPQLFVDGFGPAIGLAAGLALLGSAIGIVLPTKEVSRETSDGALPSEA